MAELTMTPSTFVLLAVVVALAALAVHRLLKRGMCDCSDHCGGCGGKGGRRAGATAAAGGGTGGVCAHCAGGCDAGGGCAVAAAAAAKLDDAFRG